MKFQVLLAALVGIAFTQNGYQVGSTTTVTLPTVPPVTKDVQETNSEPSKIVIPTFPTADILKLKGGSTNT